MQGKQDTKAPNFSQDYERGLQVYLKYLPRELKQELGYRQEYDPKFIEQQLELQAKYDPQVASEQMAALERRDPEWLATHRGLGAKVQEMLDRGYVDPQRAATYTALGKQTQGDILRGGTMSPETLRQTTQAIMSQRPGLSYGEAQDMATAVYTGQRGETLKQQRQQAANQFLGQQSEQGQALAQAGSFLSSPTTNQMINQVQPVQAPRAFGYVNPNAGYQGAQYGLQDYQYQLAQQSGAGSSNSNPWLNALQGASTGASYGSIGGGYGAAGGAVTGAAAGALGYPQYSDERGKINISRTGLETPDGIPIVTYDYNGKRWRGVIAQEVAKVRPDAVHHYSNGMLGVFYSKLGLELEEVKNG